MRVAAAARARAPPQNLGVTSGVLHRIDSLDSLDAFGLEDLIFLRAVRAARLAQKQHRAAAWHWQVLACKLDGTVHLALGRVLPVATVDLIVDLLLPPEPFFSGQTADEVWRAHP